ncbi:SRPBCC family protein [Fulvivirga sedimenti]|uniref:SRPBCC family protein n=1 Tax=Fulvivirga sedimenti TaxID=2879465 RepID=A0A9X1KYJ2_9BACT|nr:SRPBCC family protein [Fulvivirga sedimenti]MCA6073666.1 SRPBCC family protein [Fulvivirga sedimenti]
MRIYQLKRTQFLPISIETAWSYFSSPHNLREITPPDMKFRILYVSGGEKMYAGQLIRYFVNVLPWISVHWVTEITHVQEPVHFVDEQRFGPYALWHHQHFFREVDGGVEMTDEVNYAIPFGWLGQFANWLFVGKKVRAIFDYRYNVLEELFKNSKEEIVIA